MKFHLIGVGGAGMNVVARLLIAEGHTVSGSDRDSSDVLDELAELGVETFVGHDARHVPADAIVVRSSAIKPVNPEYAVAIERGQDIWHRSQALAFAAGSAILLRLRVLTGKPQHQA